MRGLLDGLRSPHPLGASLPALLAQDELVQRMMLAFDEVLAPVFSTLDNLPAHLDPWTCPEDWVDWLAEWVAVPGVAHVPLAQRRARVAGAFVEHVAGGTLTGLEATMTGALGGVVEVTDSGGTSWSPVPGGPLPGTAAPVVTLKVRAAGATVEQVLALASELVPVHVRVEVEVSAP